MYGAFLKWGYPQIVHSWLNISLQKTTSYWGTPHLWKPPYIYNIYIYRPGYKIQWVEAHVCRVQSVGLEVKAYKVGPQHQNLPTTKVDSA